MKSEATLTARIDALLSHIFPSFREVDIRHQESFSLTFGHNNLTVDTKEKAGGHVKAIYDILVTVDGDNAILLELKKEGLALTPDNKEQAFSYARIVHPMPPLVVVSNGTETRFYNTYTREELTFTEISADLVKNLIDKGFKLAAGDFKNAVDLLLGNEPALFAKFINNLSREEFNRHIGKLEDNSKPICEEFQIRRKLIDKIISAFANGHPIVAITGAGLCGKTNILYQFFNQKAQNAEQRNFVFYIDCSDLNYSIFRKLANKISAERQFIIDENKIREWMILSLNVSGCFYLIIDNFRMEISERIKSDLLEMIDLFKNTKHKVIFSADQQNYEKLTLQEGRFSKTVIGDLSKVFKVYPLDQDEYEDANNLLLSAFKCPITDGGHFALEYRHPRLLRQLAINYRVHAEEGLTYIPSVPNYAILHCSANSAFVPAVKKLYSHLTSCFIEERLSSNTSSYVNVSSYGSGAITLDLYRKKYPNELALINSDLIELRNFEDGQEIILPKIPELVAFAAIDMIRDSVLQVKNKTIKEICDHFISLVQYFPFYDVIGARVLIEIAYKNEIDLFTKMINYLYFQEPRPESIRPGTKSLMYTDDTGHIEWNFPVGAEDASFTSNFLPFAILSQLASEPLRLEDTGEGHSEFAFHRSLLYRLGSHTHFLGRVAYTSLKQMPHYDSWNFDGIGTIVSGKEGIIEPIVQSIRDCFIKLPHEFTDLYIRGIEENNFPLIWRIHLALRTLLNIEKKEVAAEAAAFMDLFHDYFEVFMANFLTKDIADADKRARVRKKCLNKMVNR